MKPRRHRRIFLSEVLKYRDRQRHVAESALGDIVADAQTFAAFMDTCVLVPSAQRDLLLETVFVGASRPLWSARVEEEVRRTTTALHEQRGCGAEGTRAPLMRLLQQAVASGPVTYRTLVGISRPKSIHPTGSTLRPAADPERSTSTPSILSGNVPSRPDD